MSLAAQVLDACRAKGWTLATAESCTGGMIIAALTDIAGSSTAVDRGFITYSNEAKIQMLDVSPELLATFGAVSEAVARDMAAGARAHSNVNLSIAVTGIAGPGGGSADKPVGLVYMAVATAGEIVSERHVFTGDRAAVRSQTVEAALALALTQI